MPHNPDDPRVRKTRRFLQEAFFRLVEEKGYDSISIQDIASEADVARVTFYRHYRDKEDLLTDCLDAVYQRVVAKIEGEVGNSPLHPSAPIRAFYEHLEAEEKLYRVLFSSPGSRTVVQRLTHYMSDRLLEQLDQLGIAVKPGFPLDIIGSHLANAQIGLGIWWLEEGRPYPIEEIAELSMSLSLFGILNVLGVEKRGFIQAV